MFSSKFLFNPQTRKLNSLVIQISELADKVFKIAVVNMLNRGKDIQNGRWSISVRIEIYKESQTDMVELKIQYLKWETHSVDLKIY